MGRGELIPVNRQISLKLKHEVLLPMMKMKALALSLSVAALSLGMVGNAAADGAALFKAKTCFSCHGQDAKTPIMPVYPKLAGQNADYAFNQMMDIKSGKRNNGQTAAMKGIMAMVSEAEAREIANWLSSL
jgi:cytochrome c